MGEPGDASWASSRRAAVLGLALGVLTAVNLWQRLRLGYNGPYLDESDYLYVGKVLKEGRPWNSYIEMFSSHIPLHVLGIGESLGGLHGARAVSAVLGVGSLGFVFGGARALFGSTRVASWTVALMSLQAPHVFISKFATDDIVAFFFFSGSLWLLIEGLNRRREAWLLCMAASVAFTVAVLSKYVVIVHAPVLAVVVALRRPRLLAFALLPCALLLADYAYRHWDDLNLLYQRQVLHPHATNRTPPGVLRSAAIYVAPVLGLAIASVAMLVSRTGLTWRAVKVHVFAMTLGLPLLGVHVASADRVSMFTHMVYPALMLAPLAAWFLHRLARRSLGLPLALTAAIAGIGIYQTSRMERSFPDLTSVVAYLEPRFGPTTTILSEEGYVFRYRLSYLSGRNNFHDMTWFDNDGDHQRTPKDVIEAIWDGKPDYVMIFGQITPKLSAKLRTAVLPHQYRRVFEQPYHLSNVRSSFTQGSVELWMRNGTYKGKYPL